VAAARSLGSGFLAACERFPERPALEVEGKTFSYRDLRDRAAALAATVAHMGALHGQDHDAALTAVFARRSATAFAGVLAALLRGHGYVPLNPTFPVERSKNMLERSGSRCVIVDGAAEAQLRSLLEKVEVRRVWILPERDDVDELRRAFPAQTFVGARELAAPQEWREAPADPDGIAYLLFTSGSTGIPKGVMVAHRNVTAFVDAMVERYAVDENDRFSQMFEMTFDLSAFDVFVAWERGACVCCPSPQDLLMPARYVASSGITFWFSVPSTGVLMNKLRMLKKDLYPSVRFALFCGEALPAEIAQAFAVAMPNAIVENLYGPTELTIACTLYRWHSDSSPSDCENGLVPIGVPYPGMQALVVDESLMEVAPGETGELLMTGPQLTLGYWQDPERTRTAFRVPPGRQERFYRTGDRVRRPLGAGPLVYLGRLDQQLKVHGYRVELGEIEAVLRQEAGIDVAIAVGWPRSARGAEGIVAFLAADEIDQESLRERLKGRLPPYMVPKQVIAMSRLPLNSNGKVDRGALLETLEAATKKPSATPAVTPAR
jgi:amino acid adenylation domain-containing protein